MKILRLAGLVAIGLAAVSFFKEPAQAVPIETDEIIFATEGGTDPSRLSGSIEMMADKDEDKLSINITNTSLKDTSNEASSLLLTGLGFNLGGKVEIDSGTATAGDGSKEINFHTNDGSLSKEWGFANAPSSGPFQSSPDGDVGDGSVDTVVSTLIASIDSPFESGTIDKSPDVSGPDFGLLSNKEEFMASGGLEAIQDTIEIELVLSGNVPMNLTDEINDGHVVLSFGSPHSSTVSVPTPATLPLLGLSLIGFGLFLRRKHAA